jgi:hypothetical protein
MTARPVFFLVTGSDFARSIAWAKTAPRLRDLIAAKVKVAAK